MHFDPDPDFMTAPLPCTLWIELTSRCSLDCIFCSRKSRLGAGEHMAFDLYRSLLSELEEPEVICLNYSGESIEFPRLSEAIRLARATGAQVELVSTLVTARPQTLQELVESGLHRLTISLHTMDPVQYKELYRCGSLSQLRVRILELLGIRSTLGVRSPRLDFAFVAMRRNLEQIPCLAGFAREVGVRDIFVHPVLRRDPIGEKFAEELDSGRLREEFRRDLISVCDEAQRLVPGISIMICNPDVQPRGALSSNPACCPGPLPEGAHIRTCDQNPWETAHVLANGDLVVCEVQDHHPMGNLKTQSLQSIWTGESYRAFRRAYQQGQPDACSQCPWKKAYIPAPLSPSISPGPGTNSQILRGWHARDGSGTIWSKRRSRAVLSRAGCRTVRIQGVLPYAHDGQENQLEILSNGVALGRISNPSRRLLRFDACFGPVPEVPVLNLDLITRFLFSPLRAGINTDVRELGFALFKLEMVK